MKKIVYSICFLLILSMILPVFTYAGDVSVNVTEKFTDEAFRDKVLEAIGKEKGDRIFDTDVAGIKDLFIHSKAITDLSGIEYFESLERLDVGYCSLTSLDVSSLKNLQTLDCYGNKLKSLEVTGLPKLRGIVCYYNFEMTSLKVSDLPSLIYVSCGDTELSELDLSAVPSLEELSCKRTKIRELDVSGCPNMKSISADIADKWTIKGYRPEIEYDPSYNVDDTASFDPGHPFRDVKESDWFYKNVIYVYENGIMNGFSGNFSPNSFMTRAMTATIIFRSFNYSADAEERFRTREIHKSGFEDVPNNTWYTAAVNCLTERKIIFGKSEKKFDPNAPITRADFAVLLYRFVEQNNSYLQISPDRTLPSDYKSVPSYAKAAVSELFKAEVILGRTGDVFDSGALITRAEAAAMFQRCLSAMKPIVTPEPIDVSSLKNLQTLD